MSRRFSILSVLVSFCTGAVVAAITVSAVNDAKQRVAKNVIEQFLPCNKALSPLGGFLDEVIKRR